MDSNKEESNTAIFDYVIVGAGPSAMGILRGLLEAEISESADRSSGPSKPQISIAIVERGDGPPHDISTRSPERWYEAANLGTASSKSVRLFPSEITGRTMEIPVGQGLGGTSNVNACLCLPPLQQDLESWPEPYRSSLVSTAEYLIKIMEESDVIHHRPIENTRFPFSIQKSILDFYQTVPTMTARNSKTNKMVRKNYFDALVEPLLAEKPSLGKHLNWFRGYEVQRLLVEEDDSTQVIGIECAPANWDRKSRYRKIYAKNNVILCTGAIETPALLLVSKLGDKEPLLGVGQRLMDQALLARVYMKSPSLGSNKSSTSPNGITALGHIRIERKSDSAKYQTFQVAVTDSVANASIIPSVVPMALRWRCKSKVLTAILEVSFHYLKAAVRVALLYTPLGFLLSQLTTTTMIFLMHPRSRGSVTIALRKDFKPEDEEPKRRKDVHIDANPNYLGDARDVEDFKHAWDSLGRTSSSSFELFPNLIFSVLKLFPMDNLWFQSYCSCFLLPYYHFAGSCAMITDASDNPNWVVDSSLKVRGHNGLYICDASVFPSMISNPPALACAALGYMFARSILADGGRK